MVAQTWAWATMVNDRVPQQGVVSALDSTFSGDSPCAMCCAITEERQDNQEQAPIPESDPAAKFLLVAWRRVDFVWPPSLSHLLRLREMKTEVLGREDEPSLPPPQLA